MGRTRKKDPPAWGKYRPGIDALYWKFGGPFIPVDRIVPAEDQVRQNNPNWIAQHVKPASARLKYAERELARAEQELAEHVGLYLKYHEQGIDALPYEYLQKADRDQDQDPDRWKLVPRNVDMRRASAFVQVGYYKARIASLKALIEQLERPARPLFYLGD